MMWTWEGLDRLLGQDGDHLTVASKVQVQSTFPGQKRLLSLVERVFLNKTMGMSPTYNHQWTKALMTHRSEEVWALESWSRSTSRTVRGTPMFAIVSIKTSIIEGVMLERRVRRCLNSNRSISSWVRMKVIYKICTDSILIVRTK